MVESKMSMSEKFDYILHYMKKIAGRVEFRIFVLIFSTAQACRKQQQIFEIQIDELPRTFVQFCPNFSNCPDI